MNHGQPIAPGVRITSSGQAIVDPSLTEVLVDLAIQLEESTDLPVDVEHVLAALVLAGRSEEINPAIPLSSNDPALMNRLAAHVRRVFAEYGGTVGQDDV